ncbi:MAG: hypothetical protein IID59_10935 [Proteobacteria bacterium]|nr:hypothetical protein [Pseudomonadota bacterium]
MSKKFKIPEVLGPHRLEDQAFIDCWTAANKHAKKLTKAETEISVARDLCETLLGHLESSEAGVEYTVVELIEKRIAKARDLISSHSRAHDNLFIAYFDLKGGVS